MTYPYSVWWKRQGEWVLLYETHNPDDAMNYARNNITHGHTTQRIEIRDGNGVVETLYDEGWNQPHG